MKKRLRFLVILPFLCGGLLMILDSALFRTDLPAVLAFDVFAVDVFLTMMPYPVEEGSGLAGKHILALTSVSALTALAVHFLHGPGAGFRIVISAVLYLLSLAGFLFKVRTERKKMPVMESYSRTVFVLAVLILLVAFMEGGVYGGRASLWVVILMYVSMVASVVCLFLCVRGDRPRRAVPEAGMQPDEPALPPYDAMDERARMDTLFGRVDELMKEKKLFLDEDLTLKDISLQLSCNKVYVSRAILDKTGLNFRQYINRYRIDYALEMLGRNPDMKVSELSGLCGFHSQPTFNLAFRMNQHMTPSEWKRGFRRS